VIVTSDHGELFDEHVLLGHGLSLYREVLEVPLVMWGPGIPAGLRIPAPVSLRDLAATITDLARATDAALPGSSLAALWREGDSATTSPIFARVTRPRICRARTGHTRTMLAEGCSTSSATETGSRSCTITVDPGTAQSAGSDEHRARPSACARVQNHCASVNQPRPIRRSVRAGVSWLWLPTPA
jgi:hypothetical protein